MPRISDAHIQDHLPRVVLLVISFLLIGCGDVYRTPVEYVSVGGVFITTDPTWLSEFDAKWEERHAAQAVGLELDVPVINAFRSIAGTQVVVENTQRVSCQEVFFGIPLLGCTVGATSTIKLAHYEKNEQQTQVYRHELAHMMLWKIKGNMDPGHKRTQLWNRIDTRGGD